MFCSRISKSRSSTFSKAPPDNAETQTHTAKHTPAYSLGNLKEAVQRHRRTEAAPGWGLGLGASPGPWPIHPLASGRPNEVVSVLWLEYPVSLKEKIFKHTTKCPLKMQTLPSVLFRSLFYRGNEVDWGIPGQIGDFRIPLEELRFWTPVSLPFESTQKQFWWAIVWNNKRHRHVPWVITQSQLLFLVDTEWNYLLETPQK